jgi:hypothetical protein
MNLLFYLFENQNHNVHFLNILVSFNFMIAICKANNFFEENIMLSSWLCNKILCWWEDYLFPDRATCFYSVVQYIFVPCTWERFYFNFSKCIFFKYLYTYPLSWTYKTYILELIYYTYMNKLSLNKLMMKSPWILIVGT